MGDDTHLAGQCGARLLERRGASGTLGVWHPELRMAGGQTTVKSHSQAGGGGWWRLLVSVKMSAAKRLIRKGSCKPSSQAPCDCLRPGRHTHEGHPRGLFRAGSCVTDKATEPCARSHVYLWRPRQARARQGQSPRTPGKGSQLHTFRRPAGYSRGSGGYQQAVIRGQAHALTSHCHHGGALL